MPNKISDITIIGGGDAGLLTGLCIRKLNPKINISVVDDFQEKHSDVGKSTFHAIVGILHNFLEINDEAFVQEVKPIFKATVYFRDWCGYTPFHHPFDLDELTPNGPGANLSDYYYYLYDTFYTDPDCRTPNEEMVEQGKTPFYFNRTGAIEMYPNFAYHLNTNRFNSFLEDICRNRNINLQNDVITDCGIDGNHVTRLRGENNTYTSDLYIDASGFNRVIKEKQDSSFNKFDLPLDSAFNTKVERPLSDVVPATVVETGEHGWFWQIDTFDNRDLGYVFASDYVSDDDALSEFLDHCGESVLEDNVQKYEFNSGYYENAWQGNCITIGNAEGFIEPLQSTALTANAVIAQLLSVLLSSHQRIDNTSMREKYNAYVQNVWESIQDFITVHYLYSKGTNKFWHDITSIEPSTRVNGIIQDFNTSGIAISESVDFKYLDHTDGANNLVFFPPSSFHSIMRKMGCQSEFYEHNNFNSNIEIECNNAVDQYLTVEEFYEGYVPS